MRVVCPDQEKKSWPGYYVVPKINFGIFNKYVAKNGVCLGKADLNILYEAISGADIVHCNFPGVLSYNAVDIAHSMGIPVTASTHAQAENFTNHVYLSHFEPANKAMYKIMYNVLFKKVDAIHYPSQFMRDVFEFQNHFISNGYVISNGVRSDFVHRDIPKPEGMTNRIIITYTARYSKEKCPFRLLKAVKYSKYKDRIQLIMPGEGPLQSKMERYTRKWKNPPIYGFHSHEEMIDILSYSDLYCHVSEIDLEAISALEAISMGLTPILSDSKKAAIRYFALSPHNLFHYSSSKDLAAKIDFWVDHPRAKRDNSQQYLGFAKRFDFQTCMNKMEEMFLETIASYRVEDEDK